MTTCTKIYHDVPFAHRQYLHDGHCAFVHGHNWDIAVTFACALPDENGFVVDFGKLGFIKEWIAQNLDHACVFSTKDPLAQKIMESAPQAWKPYFVEAPSCEGLAEHLFEIFNKMVSEHTGGRVRVCALEVSEDKKNTARYSE